MSTFALYSANVLAAKKKQLAACMSSADDANSN